MVKTTQVMGLITAKELAKLILKEKGVTIVGIEKTAYYESYIYYGVKKV